MAKKKQDTKGLAGVINKVPREIDINGQLHMLAWITPKEGKTLKDLGGAGQPGPMGIPAFYETDDMETGAGDFGMGPDDPGSREDTSAGDTSTSDAETDDPDTRGDVSDSYRGSVGPGFGSYGGGAYEGDYDRPGRSFADTSYAFQDKGRDRMYGGATKAQLEELASRDSMLSRAMQEQIKAGNVYDYVVDPKTGNLAGVTHKQAGMLGKIGNTITGLLGVDDLILGDRVYTGRSDLDPFGLDGGRDDGGRDEKKEVKSIEEAIKPVVSATEGYYAKGIGTGTLDMTDPANISKFLLQVGGTGGTGQSLSPIGATFDAATNTYTLPDGTKIDALTGRRKKLSGLNIFKAV